MTQKSYQERLKELGWTDQEADGRARQRVTHSLEELTRWVGVGERPPAPDCREVPSAEAIRGDASMVRVFDAAMSHAIGRRRITDPDVIAAIDERSSAFVIEVAAAPNIVVTAADPLILNSSSGVWLYDTVTIKDGGYIAISATGHFECSTLIKESSQAAGADYDISVLGKDGTDQPKPDKPGKPAKAKNGQDAECDCCGGLVDKDGTNGADGTDGLPGVNGLDGGNGSSAPTVVLSLGQVTGSVTLRSRGGIGGIGGAGGDGGDGGDGGNGGDDIQCGAIKGDGGSGGNGGNGSNGANAGNGGNGAGGGNVSVDYDPASVGRVIAVAEEASGGGGGTGGQVGSGGAGGASGGRGASPGAQGQPGTQKGNDGNGGNRGSKGSLTVNGTPV